MKLWQKTYLLSTILCALILYGCMFSVTAPVIVSTIKGAQAAALREERSIARALEQTVTEVPEHRQTAAATAFLDFYRDTGLFFEIRKEQETVYTTLPYYFERKQGSEGFVRMEGHLFLFVSDILPSGFELTYFKGAENEDMLLQKQIMTVALAGTLTAMLMATALYALLYWVNLPISRLAHEMRTPLTAMKGYAETIRDVKLTEEQQHMAASYIAQESTRLTEISSKLLTMHNAKEETTTFRPVDVEEMFLHIQRTYPTVVYKVNWSTLLGDLNLLTSLFNNLVDNAVKASPEGSPVELTADINVITIRDHGKGMSDEVLAYVNHPPKHKKLHASGGLGVPLCHQIAKAHGAKLSFQRGTDGGTVATVTFYNSLID